MKQVLALCFVICPHFTFAQLEFKNANTGRIMEATDLNGHSLFTKYDGDVGGTPFIRDKWMTSTVTLSSGKQIGPVAIKLNIESNEIYFLDSSGKEMVAVDGIVRKVECRDEYSRDGIPYIFKNGYPAIDQQKETFYYQVLAAGQIELLARNLKYIRTQKNDLTGERSREFVDAAVTLYVYANNTMQAFRPTRASVLSLMKDKEQAVTLYIESYKINLRNTADLVKLFNFYNSSR